MKHTIRYSSDADEIQLTVPWGLQSGMIPPPEIVFYPQGEEPVYFLYGGTVDEG